MITQLSFKAPSAELTELKNLWFQLTGSNCNLKCRHCYLSCSPNNKSNFLPIDKIKSSLEELKNLKISEIYLHGGEPLLHPDINNIIRLTLKHTNVTILTNGTLINDKKARFLRQIEQNNDNEIIFRVGIDHYIEEKNDEIRGKGSFKKAISGVENLVRYGFNPIISVVNLWNEEENDIKAGFSQLLSSLGFESEEINFKIIPVIKLGEYAKNFMPYKDEELVMLEKLSRDDMLDCKCTRVISHNGVFVCPVLINDPRGKVGTTLADSSRRFFLELNACSTCQMNEKGIFNNNWKN